MVRLVHQHQIEEFGRGLWDVVILRTDGLNRGDNDIEVAQPLPAFGGRYALLDGKHLRTRYVLANRAGHTQRRESLDFVGNLLAD